MKHYNLTASRLRVILSILLFVIIAIAVAIAYIAYGELRKTAIEVSHASVEANASQDNLQSLLKIQQTLAKEAEAIERTNSIVADSQSYQYQDQIISDLQGYATKAGIEITNIDFSSAATSKPGATPATPTTPAPSGVKSTSVAVTLKNPIDYTSFLRFLKSIEQNLTKMQVSKISLSKGGGNDVSSEALAVEVYIR